MTRSHLFVLGLCLLAACFEKSDDDEDDGDGDGGSGSLTQAEFAHELAVEACTLYERCDLLDFFGGDFDTCVVTLEEATLDYVGGADCDYDSVAAAECVAEFEGYGCTEDTGETTETPCDFVCGTSSGGGDSSSY